jgi:hypothetical protein
MSTGQRWFSEVSFLSFYKEFGSFEVNVIKDDQPPVLIYSGLKDGKIRSDMIGEVAKSIHELWRTETN